MKTEPIPPELLHDPSLQDNKGETCAMYWIQYRYSLPPKEILHDPSLQDKQGKTCATHWAICMKTEPPPELRF